MKLFRVSLFALSALTLSAAHGGAAPKFLGPNKCSSCHDHEKQKEWAAKDTHAKALSQLDDKNAAKYAKAIGLSDPYNLKGSCVGCHATVFNGDANAGVSCETCHGAGSDYVEPHQTKGNYNKAVSLGMFDTRGNYPIWAKMCVDCHVVRDAKLVAAGHKSGSDFDAGVFSQKIVHWLPSYDWAKLSAAGKAAGSKGGGAAPAKAAAPAPAPKPAPTQPPAPAPTEPRAAPPAKPTPAPAARATPETAQERPAKATVPAERTPARATETKGRSMTAVPPLVTPARGQITIEIQATPIPAPTPVAKGRSAPAPVSGGAPQPRKTPPRAKKPRPRGTAAHLTPGPTRTPTKIPVPQEPPRRAPH